MWSSGKAALIYSDRNQSAVAWEVNGTCLEVGMMEFSEVKEMFWIIMEIHCQKSLNFVFKMCAFIYVKYTSVKLTLKL